MTKKQSRRHLPVVQSDERYRENYEHRKAIADASRSKLEAAIEACGPGADGYGYWLVRDTTGQVADRIVYCAHRESTGGWHPKAGTPEPAERVLDESRASVVKGVTYYPMRWSVSFSAIGTYSPRTPEQMKAAAEARRAKAAARQEADDLADAERRAIQTELKL